MTRKREQEFDAVAELCKLLEEADLNVKLFGYPVSGPHARAWAAAIETRIASAVAAEREACAKAAVAWMKRAGIGGLARAGVLIAIRARGSK